MRHGYRLPTDVPLSSKAEGNEELAAQLRAIELRAFEQSGRFDRMKAEAEAEAEVAAKKQKIVGALKGDGKKRR